MFRRRHEVQEDPVPEPDPEPAAPKLRPMAGPTEVNLKSLEDLSYLAALVDTSARLIPHPDMPLGALSDWWRGVLIKLIHIAQEHAGECKDG